MAKSSQSDQSNKSSSEHTKQKTFKAEDNLEKAFKRLSFKCFKKSEYRYLTPGSLFLKATRYMVCTKYTAYSVDPRHYEGDLPGVHQNGTKRYRDVCRKQGDKTIYYKPTIDDYSRYGRPYRPCRGKPKQFLKECTKFYVKGQTKQYVHDGTKRDVSDSTENVQDGTKPDTESLHQPAAKEISEESMKECTEDGINQCSEDGSKRYSDPAVSYTRHNTDPADTKRYGDAECPAKYLVAPFKNLVLNNGAYNNNTMLAAQPSLHSPFSNFSGQTSGQILGQSLTQPRIDFGSSFNQAFSNSIKSCNKCKKMLMANKFEAGAAQCKSCKSTRAYSCFFCQSNFDAFELLSLHMKKDHYGPPLPDFGSFNSTPVKFGSFGSTPLNSSSFPTSHVNSSPVDTTPNSCPVKSTAFNSSRVKSTPFHPTPPNSVPSISVPSNSTPFHPIPSNSVPSNPTPSNPTPSNPTPSNPTPSNPTPSNSTPSNSRYFGFDDVSSRHKVPAVTSSPAVASDLAMCFCRACHVVTLEYKEFCGIECREAEGGTSHVLVTDRDELYATRRFICHKCETVFPYVKVAEYHVNTMCGRMRVGQPRRCKLCDDVWFKSMEEMDTHWDSVHKTPKLHKCPECNREFERKSCLRKHRVQQHHHHGFKFDTLTDGGVGVVAKKSHKCNHFSKKSHKCNQCSKKSHKCNHCSKKSRKCSQCSKKLVKKVFLANHLAKVLGVENQQQVETKFECKHCGKKFRRKARLVLHERNHAVGPPSPKPLLAPPRLSHLVKKEATKKILHCPTCGEACEDTPQLYKHHWLVHKLSLRQVMNSFQTPVRILSPDREGPTSDPYPHLPNIFKSRLQMADDNPTPGGSGQECNSMSTDDVPINHKLSP